MSTSKVSPSSSKWPDPSAKSAPIEYLIDSHIELENVSSVSEEDSLDDEAMVVESNSALKVLESRLLSVLHHDLALAVRLVPRIYHQVQSGLAFETISGQSGIPSDVNDGTSAVPLTQGEVSQSRSTPATNRATRRQRKHGRESDSNDEGGSNSPKKSRSKLPDDPDEQFHFACHFHKKDPPRYNPHVDRKYLYCICPLKTPEFRRFKYVLPYSFLTDVELT